MVSRSINLKLICTSEFFQKPEIAIAINFSYKSYVILALQVPSFSPSFKSIVWVVLEEITVKEICYLPTERSA